VNPDAPAASNVSAELAPSRLKFVLRALRSRNYRLFFAGQVISLIGNWLTSVAIAWLVYRLTHSAALLGVVGFCGQIPAFVISPFAGVLVDRWNLQRTIITTQTLAMLQSFALAFFALTGTIDVPHLIVLAIFQGFVNAFDIPARQAFVVQMVESRDDLPNAIALNSTIVNAARLLGPSLAGLMIAAFGEGWCFLIDGISYCFVILALMMMRLSAVPPRAPRGSVLGQMREGFGVAFGFPPMRALLLLLALVSLVGVPYTTLLPIFAQDVLHGGPKTLGALSGAAGAGALAGAIFLASRRNVLGLGRVMTIGCAAFGLGLILFSFSTNLYLSIVLMTITGCAMILQMASGNTLLQTLAEDDMRGRIMSFFTMAFMGTMPVGSLVGGVLAQHIGAPRTVRFGGAACIVAALVFRAKRPALRRMVEPIFVRRGILPEVAAGMQSAAGASQAQAD
jgi:MFS family permease